MDINLFSNPEPGKVEALKKLLESNKQLAHNFAIYLLSKNLQLYEPQINGVINPKFGIYSESFKLNSVDNHLKLLNELMLDKITF